MQTVMLDAKTTIQRSDFDAKKQELPSDALLLEGVAKVVENTAFLAEMALYFPDFVGRAFKDQDFWKLYNWAYEFSQFLSLYDKSTKQMLNIGAQQLNIIPREDDFVNSYSSEARKEQIEREELRKMSEESARRKVEKTLSGNKSKAKRPSLSKVDLWSFSAFFIFLNAISLYIQFSALSRSLISY